MASRLEFVIPGKPRTWKRPRVLKRGWTYDANAKDKKFIAELALQARLANGMAYFRGPVRFYGYFYGLRSNQDLDNAIKLVLDSLNRMVYDDDRQVKEIHAFKCVPQIGVLHRSDITVEAIFSG